MKKITKIQVSAPGVLPYSSWPDIPVDDPRADKLNRSDFARAVAKAIRKRSSNDSFVFALYGSWGTGKTSVANLVVAHLNHGLKESLQIPVVRFNPWLCADVQQMAAVLFKELGQAVVAAGPAEDAAGRAAAWERYRAFLSVTSATVATIAGWLELLEVPFAKLAKTIGEASEKAAKLPEEAAKAASEEKAKGLLEVKRELTKQLASLPTPILVIIDDIDRLRAAEVVHIFQLIKASGDFPNLVYLLLFQRDVVERNLDEHSPGTGAEFLKKIVQEGLDIPKIRPERIQDVLFEQCPAVFKAAWPEARNALLNLHPVPSDHKTGTSLDSFSRFGCACLSYFTTLRDVWRFLNAADFQARLLELEDADGPLVNGADLFGLEILRMFEPAVYHELGARRDTLFPTGSGALQSQVKDILLTTHNAVIRQASQNRMAEVADILDFLYPHFTWSAEANRKSIHPVTSSHVGDFFGGRLAHPDCADRFFEFRLDEEAQIVGRLRTLRDAVRNDTPAEGLIASFHETGCLEKVFWALSRDIERLESDFPFDSLIVALCNAGDTIPDLRRSTYPSYEVITACLARTPETLGMMALAIRKSTGLWIPLNIAYGSLYTMNRNSSFPEPFFPETHLNTLKEECINRFKAFQSHLRPELLRDLLQHFPILTDHPSPGKLNDD